MNAVEPRPGGVATISAPDDAPVTAEAAPSDAAQPDAAQPDVAQPDAAQPDATAEAVESDAATEPGDGAAEPQAVPEAVEPEDAVEAVEPEDAAAEATASDAAETVEPEDLAGEPVPLLDAPDAPPVTAAARPVTRRRSPLRRAAVVGALTVVAALAVSAFATVGPVGGDADQHFVDTARSQGHTVTPGQQQALVVSAARKICDRKESHTTIADRKATALSRAELGAVTATFDDDARGFTELALQTYCAR